MLNLSVEELGKTVIMRCAGRIVRGDETTLLCATVGQYGRDIVLDLSEVEAIDAAGIGALISLQAAGLYLRLMNPTKAVREVLRVTGMDSVLEICSIASAKREENVRQPASSSIPFAHFGAAT
ncbi:MAG: STAS domain-containing protein [Candidatus Sulfotelmatobacter sp.]